MLDFLANILVSKITVLWTEIYRTKYIIHCTQVQMQLQKLKEGPVLAQTTSSEMLRKALSEKQVKRNGKRVVLIIPL